MKRLMEKMKHMANDGDWRIYTALFLFMTIGSYLFGAIFAVADIKWSNYMRNKKNH